MAIRFGVERAGLLGVIQPRLVAALLIIATALALVGVQRMSVDDSLSELFRSDTPEFQQYERLSERFPSSEYDVLAVAEGPDLLTQAGLEALRNFVIELQFIDATKGVVSMFSAREPPNAQGFPENLFPENIPDGEALSQLVERIRTNEIVKGRFLSEDGTLTLIVVPLDRKIVEERGLGAGIGEIERTARETLKDTQIRISLSGVPVMQLEIRNAVQRDRLIYNGIGFLFGALICFAYFRRPSFTLIAVAAPAVAVIWALGVLGWLDIRLNLFLNIITPLIMVISFADAMHMIFDVRRQRAAGMGAVEAARHAVLTVGPAAFLTLITNQAAFVSLVLSDSALIRTFGFAGMLSTTMAFFAVILLVPTLSILLVRNVPSELAALSDEATPGKMQRGYAAHLLRFAGVYAAIGVLLCVALGSQYVQLQPQYRMADQVPDREQALSASSKLDTKLTGANPVHVLVEWKDGRPLYDPEIMSAIAAAHRVVEAQAGLGNVWSIETLRRWLKESGQDDPAIVKRYVDLLPDYLTRRFLTKEEDAVVITGRLPDIDVSGILPVVDKLHKALEPVRAAYPGVDISVTGLPAIAARNTEAMIGQLNWGLFGDVFLAILVIALAFRSMIKGVYSLLPNLLPIFAAGAVLHITGIGLQFASIIALTVAFGLAIDNIVHFLYRLSLEDQADHGRGGGLAAVRRTIQTIGPVILLTTAVLIAGLAMPIFSALPSLRLFGMLNAVTLTAALVSVMVFLPAIIVVMRKLLAKGQKPGVKPTRLRFRDGGPGASPSPAPLRRQP